MGLCNNCNASPSSLHRVLAFSVGLNPSTLGLLGTFRWLWPCLLPRAGLVPRTKRIWTCPQYHTLNSMMSCKEANDAAVLDCYFPQSYVKNRNAKMGTARRQSRSVACSLAGLGRSVGPLAILCHELAKCLDKA